MSIRLIKPGLLTTIQDEGRYGYQKQGILVSGAMDKLALRLGNLLAGNTRKEAGLEITQVGPQIEFLESQLIAVTGGDLSPAIHQWPVPMWRPVYVKKGSVLTFGKPKQGCRAYIAFAGGLDVPEVLGSYATYLRAGIGGWHGRALEANDTIPFKKDFQPHVPAWLSGKSENFFVAARWVIGPPVYPMLEQTNVIRIIKGPEYELFTEESKHNFRQTSYTITQQSDRMGYRLSGAPLSVKVDEEMLSSAVTFGTIQVPANGEPIILMADHQTTGGYPRIGQVVRIDLPRLAQAMPGSTIFFNEISLKEAELLYLAQEKNIARLTRALHLRVSANLLG